MAGFFKRGRIGGMAAELWLLIIVAITAWLVIGPVSWAIWYARRSFRYRRFGLRGLLFAFTIVALLIGTFSVLFHG
jgi:hypothetical protein